MSINVLIADNVTTLNEALALLDVISAAHYTQAGPHLRHVLDHYRCLLAGLEQGVVDYDRRQRCRETEHSAVRARHTLKEVCAGLQALVPGGDRELRVRMATATDGQSVSTVSSLGRELQFLQGHAVHHFALIRQVLTQAGLSLPESFGKAAATIQYERAFA